MKPLTWIYLIFVLLLCIFAFQNAFATEDAILTFQTDEVVKLDAFCIAGDGTPCNSSATCVISTYFPNWSLNFSSKPMSYQGDGFYKVNLSQYSITGDYKGFVQCNYGHRDLSDRADFRIVEKTTINTLEGNDQMIALALTLIVVIVFFSFVGFVNQSKFVKFFGYGMALIELVVLLGAVYAEYAGGDIEGLLWINFISVLIVGGYLGGYTIIMVLLTSLGDDGNNKGNEDFF